MSYPSPPVQDWPEDKRVAWEERAAIKQYDGKTSRVNAEWEAYYELRSELDEALDWMDDTLDELLGGQG